MYNKQENEWTEKICELLKKELDNSKYEVSCFERIPYSIFVDGYKDNREELEIMKYEVDLLVKEKRDDYSIPRLIIESKYRAITTHDVITYNDKAKRHKELFCGLRYGLMIGNSVEQNISSRIINNGNNFDFMLAFNNDIPNDKEWSLFVEIVKRNLENANKYEDIIKERRKKDKKRYFCIENNMVFYE